MFESNVRVDAPKIGVVYYHCINQVERLVTDELITNNLNIVAIPKLNHISVSSLRSEIKEVVSNDATKTGHLIAKILESDGETLTYMRDVARESISDIDALVGPMFGSYGTPFHKFQHEEFLDTYPVNKDTIYIDENEVFHLMLISEAIKAEKPILSVTDFTESYIKLYLTNDSVDSNNLNLLKLDLEHDVDYSHLSNQHKELIKAFTVEADQAYQERLSSLTSHDDANLEGARYSSNRTSIDISDIIFQDDALQENCKNGRIAETSFFEQYNATLPYVSSHEVLPDYLNSQLFSDM
jgi:hypothetical protein